MSKNQIILECKRVKFFSSHDEDAFFEWVKKIKSVKDVKGARDSIHLFVTSKRIKNDELYDFFSLFRRYKINTKQLDVFLNNKNTELFHRFKKSYHINVYPAKKE